MAAREPASAAASAPPPAPAVAAGKLAAQSSASGALSGSMASAGTGNAEPAPAKDAAALEKRAAAMTDKVTAERRKDMAPLAPDEWIKRIRRLIAEGKNEDAAKELLAFRREYKERSDALLPSDLRSFRQ
jgi:sarcosine oxidase gamma subunit